MDSRKEFEKWADQFDHDSNEWEDMGRDEIFKAGMQAARAQGGQGAPEWDEVMKIVACGLLSDDGKEAIVKSQVAPLRTPEQRQREALASVIGSVDCQAALTKTDVDDIAYVVMAHFKVGPKS